MTSVKANFRAFCSFASKMALPPSSRSLISTSSVPFALTCDLSPSPGSRNLTEYSWAGAASGLTASASAAITHVLAMIRTSPLEGWCTACTLLLQYLGAHLLQGGAQHEAQLELHVVGAEVR